MGDVQLHNKNEASKNVFRRATNPNRHGTELRSRAGLLLSWERVH